MSCSEKGISILATILIIVHRTKPTFRHFVWFGSLCSCQQFFSYVGTGLPGLNQYFKQGLMCFVQGHNVETPVRLEQATPRSWVKHSTTALLPYSDMNTFDESSPYMKFGRNWVMNDQVPVSTQCQANWEVPAICAAILVIVHRTIPTVDLGKELINICNLEETG